MTQGGSDHLDLAGRVSLTPARLPVREAVARIVARKATIRQERLSGIHNPWGHCLGLTDPWSFLDLCESDLVIDATRKVIGPDVILWDSELFAEVGRYGEFISQAREGRYWPVTPLAGALALVAVGREQPEVKAVGLEEIGPEMLAGFNLSEPLYVVRLMPATSRFDRDPNHPANRACMEEQVLVHYSNRPLWLLCGADRANNDLVSGFAPAVPVWASGAMPNEREEK
ncbi:resolvase [Aminobacter sp. HY435]|uniref:resolvase n=1 Tax=Aminobacter sp. HY435 TaxID=2970917 RepID=UPI0022B994B9|nr:resolvase [Aminobacter sp. HY435]